MKNVLLLICCLGVAIGGSHARAQESQPSVGASRFPDEDLDLDFLSNQSEVEAQTRPDVFDSDGDGIFDGLDAMPTNTAMRVPAAADVRYAFIDLGSEYSPSGVNDTADVLLVKPGTTAGTQVGAFWRGGNLTTIATGQEGSFRGPMLNGALFFGTPAQELGTVGNSRILSENKRWLPELPPITQDWGIYSEVRQLNTPVGLPLPSSPPRTAFPGAKVQNAENSAWAYMKSQFDPQLVNYTVSVAGPHSQSLSANVSLTNDAGDQTCSVRTSVSQTVVTSVGGTPLPPIVMNISMQFDGNQALPDFYSWVDGNIVWGSDSLVTAPTRPTDYRTNSGLFNIARLNSQPIAVRTLNNQITTQVVPNASFLVDLTNKTTPEGPYFVGHNSVSTLSIWSYGNGVMSQQTFDGSIGTTPQASHMTSRQISNQLVVPMGGGIWRNGRLRTVEALIGYEPTDYTDWNIFQVSPNTHMLLASAVKVFNQSPRAIVMIPADIAVDANRDGIIRFSGKRPQTAATLVDRTSKNMPFRFWVNDDFDGIGDGEESLTGPLPEVGFLNADLIKSKRDLEDFARLHINFGSLHTEIVAGTIRVGLTWRETGGTSPKVKVYRSADPSGSTSYVTDDDAATLQMAAPFRTTFGEVSGSTPLVLPASAWTGLTAGQPNGHFIFEATSEGKGQLCITLHKADGTPIGEGPGVWIDLVNVKNMYQRGRATPDFAEAPYAHLDSWSPPEVTSEPYDIGDPFLKPQDEQKNVVIYVHGINGPDGQLTAYSSWQVDSETVFKRLWHNGFKGRFATFKWLALTPASPFKFNESEYRGWKSGRGLAHFLGTFPSDYQKNLYSFSQGAIVCGSALTLY